MRGINSKAVYARKTKTTLTLKAGSEIYIRLKKRKCLWLLSCFNETTNLAKSQLILKRELGAWGEKIHNTSKILFTEVILPTKSPIFSFLKIYIWY